MTIPSRFPLVAVEWEDTTCIQQWMDIDEAIEFEAQCTMDWHCTTVGYLIRDDERCVIVAARTSGDQGAVGLCERIPRGMVERIVVLRPAKKAK